MKKRSYLVYVVLAMAICAQRVYASGHEISFQAVLRDEAGKILPSRSQLVEFRVYNEATGGSALWGESYSVLCDDQGLFDVVLGEDLGAKIVEGDSLARVIESGYTKELYVGVTCVGAGEMVPRQKLSVAPFAIYGFKAQSASADFKVHGKISVGQNMTVQQQIDVANDVTIDGSISVFDGVDVGESVTVSGDYFVEGTHEVRGNIQSTDGFFGRGTIPLGGIIMWSGNTSDIPDGWALCDGYEGRPNLIDKFVCGTTVQNELLTIAGEDETKLTIAQIAAHTHSLEYVTAKSKNYGVAGSTNSSNDDNVWRGGTISETRISSATGGDKPFSNLPPYYVLAYIVRVK